MWAGATAPRGPRGDTVRAALLTLSAYAINNQYWAQRCACLLNGLHFGLMTEMQGQLFSPDFTAKKRRSANAGPHEPASCTPKSMGRALEPDWTARLTWRFVANRDIPML